MIMNAAIQACYIELVRKIGNIIGFIHLIIPLMNTASQGGTILSGDPLTNMI